MTQLVKVATAMGFGFATETLNQFVALFVKWNASINLSAAKNAFEVEEHLVDSLHVVRYLADAQTALDVGAGGGFPVVVAAICLPSVQFTALEPVHKKHAFLRTAARELRLVNLESFARRVEDHDARDYDVACSRATFDLREWIETGLALVRPGGSVLGFEAIPRDDLPQPFERHPYQLAGKQRAIIVARRPS